MTGIASLIGVPGIPLIESGDDLGLLITEAVDKAGLKLVDGDILVVAQTIVSRSEGSVIELDRVVPSEAALRYAVITGKDPRVVEVVLDQSRKVVLARPGYMICETEQGFVCANAGVDASNNPAGCVSTLPSDPDESARRIARRILQLRGVNVAVLISDSEGRPFRKGAVGVAVGVHGMEPVRSFVGRPDLFGRRLETTMVCTADMVCSAAALIMGESAEGLPVVIVRGVEYVKGDGGIGRILYERDAFKEELERGATH